MVNNKGSKKDKAKADTEKHAASRASDRPKGFEPDYDSDEPAVPVRSVAPSSSKRAATQMRTEGNLNSSGPISYVPIANDVSNDDERLLQPDPDDNSASDTNVVLSVEELDREIGHQYSMNEEVVHQSENSEYGEQMEVTEGSEDREPSLPPADLEMEQMQVQQEQALLHNFSQLRNGSATQAEGLSVLGISPESIASLRSIPDLVSKLNSGVEAMEQYKELVQCIQHPEKSPFVRKTDLKNFVTFGSLQEILSKRPPLLEAEHWENLSSLLAPLKNFDKFDEKIDKLQKSLTETLGATRGCAGKLEDNKKVMVQELSESATLLNNMKTAVGDLTGCVTSVRLYVARKQKEMDDSQIHQSSSAPHSSAASAEKQEGVLANLGTMLGLATAYERNEEKGRMEKAASKAAKAKAKKFDQCVFCGSTAHHFRQCNTFKDPQSKRQVLVAQGKCLACFNTTCDGSKKKCSNKRHRICAKCSLQPMNTRIHDACMCITPDPPLGASKNAEIASIASQGSHKSSNKAKSKPEKRGTKPSNEELGADQAKRARIESLPIASPPLSNNVDKTSMSPEAVKQIAQAPKKKNRKANKPVQEVKNASNGQ